MDARRLLGASGEERVARWYSERGYVVVSRNWRCREGELDLVLRQGRTLVFCEVKTRSSAWFGEPIEAVTPTKAARIRRLAMRWLAECRSSDGAAGGGAGELRFDVASVRGPAVEVMEAAF